MIRKMGDFDVIQRTEDGYFDANALLIQWNGIDWNPKRQMSRFLESPKTKEFIEALKCDECQIAKMQHGGLLMIIKLWQRKYQPKVLK